MKPLTERQRAAVLMYEQHGTLTHAELAQLLGLPPSRRSKGPWSGWQNPAQRVIGTVIGLDRRGLVRLARRGDGRSGTAYRLSEAGEAKARELRAGR